MSKSHGAPHVYLRLQVHPKIFNSGKMELTSAGIVKTASPHKDHGRCWTIAKPTMGTRLGCTSTSAKSLQTDPEDGQSREEIYDTPRRGGRPRPEASIKRRPEKMFNTDRKASSSFSWRRLIFHRVSHLWVDPPAAHSITARRTGTIHQFARKGQSQREAKRGSRGRSFN
ncbi:uncharacterized protein LOC144198315 isoform X2 [Stigmatopora nigra]